MPPPWPSVLREDRSQVAKPDSVGVAVRRQRAEGQLVIFRGGWADLEYWVAALRTSRFSRRQAGTTGWTFPGSSGYSGDSLSSSSKTRKPGPRAARSVRAGNRLFRRVMPTLRGCRQRSSERGDLHASLLRWQGDLAHAYAYR